MDIIHGSRRNFVMTQHFVVVSAFLFSMAGFAGTPGFSVLDQGQDPGQEHGGGKIGRCMHEGWDATSPTDDQNTQAAAFVQAAKAVVDEHKDGIHQGMHDLMAAWKQHPVSRDSVIAAETELHGHFVPVQEAVRDAQIDILNLLSDDQRTEFDSAFMDCMKGSKTRL
jgi:hypothetical protein